jgi:addiction module HigA family antidote
MSITYQLENPGHPGGFVRRNILEARNLTVMAAASLLGVTRQALSDFLNEKTALTADLALRIETVFGCSMETLMELQTRFEIANARKHQAEIQSELAAAPRVQDLADRPEPIVKRAYAIG